MRNHHQLVFKNFWESANSDFHPYFKGDVAKSLLADIIASAMKPNSNPILVSSVYPDQSRFRSVSLSYIISALSRFDKSEALRRQYGHDSKNVPNPGFTNIWYTGENIRPPMHQNWDRFLSFDLDDFGGRNSYLPLWVLRLSPDIESANRIQNSLLFSRSPNTLRKQRICSVISNPEPIRMNFIAALSKYVDVDIYGKAGQPLKNKFETLQNYQFNICFENDLYPGYVTEKPFEAYLSGCIPIWRGLDEGGYLNEDAIINVTGKKLTSAIEEVMDRLQNPISVLSISAEPLLKKEYSLQALSDEIRQSKV